MRRKRAGFILATVFFVLVIMIFLAASLFRLVPSELQWASNLRQDTEAYYAATAGIKHCLAWLAVVSDPSKPNGAGFSPPFDPFGATGSAYYRASLLDPSTEPWRLRPATPTVTASPTDDTYFPPMDINANPSHNVLLLGPGQLKLENDWTASVLVFPDKYTRPHPFMDTPNPLLRPPGYVIVAAAFQDVNRNGTKDLGERYVLRAEASVVQGTFARYAYFVDKWPKGNPTSNTIRFVLDANNSKAILDGPFHSNTAPVLEIASPGGDAFFNDTNSVPHFASELNIGGKLGPPERPMSNTLTHDGIAWYGGNFPGSVDLARLPFDASNQAVEGRYERMFARGESAIRFVDRIEIPADSDSIARAAFGVTNPAAVPNVGDAGNNELYVPKSATGRATGGAVFSGPLRTCLLDVLTSAGAVEGNNSYISPVPSSAGTVGVVKVVHNHQIVYPVSTQNYDETILGVTQTSGTGAATLLAYDQNGPGVNSFEVQGAPTATVEREVLVPEFGPIPAVPVPPAQPAPPGSNGGGPPPPDGYGMTGSHTETRTVILYATETFFGHEVTYAAGEPYDVTAQVVISEIHELRTYFETYSPTDLVVPNAESTSVTLSSVYLQGTGTQPIFYDGTNFNNQLVVPPGKVAVIKHYRFDPLHHDFELLDGPLNGVYLAQGPIGSLQGWNKTPKTILAESRTWGSATQSTGIQYPITVVGPLRQFGLAQDQMPTSPDHALGIIGSEILVDPPSSLFGPGLSQFSEGLSATRPFTMVCALLATEKGFSIPPTGSMYTNSKQGTLRVIGSVAQREMGALALSGYGFGQAYRYDQFLTLGPPPLYPRDTSFTMFFFRVDPL